MMLVQSAIELLFHSVLISSGWWQGFGKHMWRERGWERKSRKDGEHASGHKGQSLHAWGSGVYSRAREKLLWPFKYLIDTSHVLRWLLLTFRTRLQHFHFLHLFLRSCNLIPLLCPVFFFTSNSDGNGVANKSGWLTYRKLEPQGKAGKQAKGKKMTLFDLLWNGQRNLRDL